MTGQRWEEAKSALRHLGKWASQYDKDGIDIYFLNHRTTHGKHGYCNLQNANEILKVLQQVWPSRGTPLGERIREIMGQYLKECRSQSRWPFRSKRPKPINVLVITDGCPMDAAENDLKEGIINAALQLDRMKMPLDQVGISFVQIGDDENAAEYLRELDDDLDKRGIRDMVDTTPYETNLSDDPEMLAKILLGGINRRVDVKGGKVVVQRRNKK
ncbi:von willebrand factor type A domain-containing protein [Phanerochaete sordida]|uniref:von willebrand factor type A domain-containing protein n=1 Tax=Phanerochaete sordida TaxID=48140 RepID=A0A9P3LDC5_9APHY|nr:von willebrand factor type A domain-containing protein [Phanerochaete sordida]